MYHFIIHTINIYYRRENCINRNPGHTPVVNGTLSEKAGAAGDRMSQDDVYSHRRCRLGIGRPKEGHHGNADGRSDVHRPGIVGDKDGTALEHGREQRNVGPPGEIDDPVGTARR